MNNRINEIAIRIDELTVDLLVPARASKCINESAINELYKLLDEVKLLVKGAKTIDRKLAGLIFFIYGSLSAEAKYVDYTSPLFMAAAKLEGYLDDILWDSPFGLR